VWRVLLSPTRLGLAHSIETRSKRRRPLRPRFPAFCMSDRKSFCRMAFQSRPSTGLEAHRTRLYDVLRNRLLRFGLSVGKDRERYTFIL